MTYNSTVAKIAFLKPDIAMVHATWEWPGFALPSGEEAKDFKGIITCVRWYVCGRHGFIPCAPGLMRGRFPRR
jgi:hypothetical protein